MSTQPELTVTALLDRLRHRHGPVFRDSTGDHDSRAFLDAFDTWCRRLDRLRVRRVAWQMPNSVQWVALDLALLATGRIAVPIPDFFTAEQTRHVLDSAGIDTFVETRGQTGAPSGSESTDAFHPGFDRGEPCGGLRISSRIVVTPPAVHAETAKITFTSGSTGQPRGVCLSAAHLLRTAASVQAAFAGHGITRHLCVLPLSLLLENVAGVYASLLNDSFMAIPSLDELGLTGSSGLNVAAFLQAQHRQQPHSIILVPQLLQVLLGAGKAGMPLPQSYRMIAVGGARVAPHLLEAAARLQLPVFEGYGLSECGSVVTLNRPGFVRHGSVGKALPHTRISIENGEIRVEGSTMLGYLGDQPAPPVISTGDLGHFDAEGYLHLDGRIRNCFITAFGRNVNPEWIESELTSEPAVAHAAVFGEALPHNIAVIVPRGVMDSAAESRITQAVQAANQRLPDYARVAQWIVVESSAFIRKGCVTGSGKVRRDQVAIAFAAELNTLACAAAPVAASEGAAHLSA